MKVVVLTTLCKAADSVLWQMKTVFMQRLMAHSSNITVVCSSSWLGKSDVWFTCVPHAG